MFGKNGQMVAKHATFWGIIAASCIVFAGHALFSELRDLLTSVKFGVAGGFGALVFDILRTYIAWTVETKNDD